MLSEALSDNSGTPGPPPLGRLLVERGFLTEELLQIGLAEHGRTGLPLGQVLIGLGFVTTATIAQALATQAGGMVKTEYGFSTGFATEQAAPLPVETAPQPPAEVIPLRQEAPQPEAPQVEAPAQQAWSAPPEVPLPPVEAPAPAPVAEVPAPPEMTLPPIPTPAPVPVPVLELHPEPAAVETHDAAEADLAMAAARIEELQAELREQLRRTEASEARLAELAADAEAARDGLSSAVQQFDSMKQEIAAARQVELELRDENERLATAAAEPTPARELQVVRMEIASMRNELTTVMEALRAVHARLGEHAATTPAPAHTPMVGVPEPNADGYRLVPN